MAEKRKISIRKILQVLLTMVVTTGCVVAMVSASRIEDGKTLKSVAVHIKNDKRYHFIQEQEIMDLAVKNRSVDIAHTTIAKLDIRGMEQVIMADPWVAHAQVFVDNDNVLQLYVTQRIPVARVFQQDGVSYYLDTTLSIMPLSGSNVYYTTVITNVPELKNDSMGWAIKKQMVTLVGGIQADSFWSAQVSQVIMDSDYSFELVPVLGDQRILFGDASRMKDKFSNLFIFYKDVLNRIGWDKYETIDVRFKGQVVASPSLPYKGPVDKAIVTMNWINSIVETEAAKDTKDSVHTADIKASKAANVKPVPLKPIPVPKQVVKPVTKTTVKPVVHAAAKKIVKKNIPVKAAPKKAGKNVQTKAADKNKEKSKTKEVIKKPKYVYPENKKN